MTNTDGRADILGAPQVELLADVAHPELGSVLGQEIDGRSDQVELRFDPSRSLELLLSDDGFPLGGVRVDWLDSGGVRAHERLRSDLAGRLIVQNVGSQPLHLRVQDARYWPTEVRLSPAARRTESMLDVRRRANLNLVVQAPGGLPVADLALELRSVEFGVSIESWATQGLIRLGGPVRTDSTGRLTVAGLPRGAYEWRTTTPDEVVFEGVFELHADSREVILTLE